MRSFYEFYHKVIKENDMNQQQNMQQPPMMQPSGDQGSQTSPPIGNPADDPDVKKAIETLKNVSDNSFQHAFKKFAKEVGINLNHLSDQSQQTNQPQTVDQSTQSPSQ